MKHGNTYIVSAGEYGKYLGNLSMTQKADGRWELDHYELITVSEDIEKDEETQKKIDELMAMVDSKYLEQFGYTKDTVLCTSDIDFAPQSDTSQTHTEVNLGSIIADAYTYAAEQVLGENTVAMSVLPSGTIRDSYTKGEITVEEVFNSYSLGIGPDEIPGYPLIGVYLTGEELRIAAEIDASISDLLTEARLYSDGLYWSYNPNRMILNKVTDVFFVNNQEERVEIDDDQLYLVIADIYSGEMLGGVTDLSMGLLSVVPKFADGTPIENFEDAIIRNGEQELKAWAAIAQYMSSFEDTDGDGIPNVPAKYSTVEGRKNVEDSKNIIDLLKNPNKFFFMIIGVVLLLLAIIAAIVVLIVKVVKKLKKRKVRK
jgi:2',3'-cyclic-nucleotide 2'-phosphodiesterase (5'-nucleotidase family)